VVEGRYLATENTENTEEMGIGEAMGFAGGILQRSPSKSPVLSAVFSVAENGVSTGLIQPVARLDVALVQPCFRRARRGL